MKLLIDDFIREHAENRGISKEWSKCLVSMCSSFISWLKINGLSQTTVSLTPPICRGYIQHVRETYRNWGAKHRYNALKLFVNYMIDKNILQQNPLRQIRAPQVHRKIPKTITDQEYQRLLDHIKAIKCLYPIEGVRNFMFFRLWRVTGLRSGEMLNLQVADFDLDRNLLQIWNGKRKRFDYLPLSVGIIPDIQEYLVARSNYKCPFFFTSAKDDDKWTKEGLRRLFIKLKSLGYLRQEITPHNFRATFCCKLLDGGANVFEVQELMRHLSLQSTIFYAKNNPAKLRDRINLLDPVAMP